MPFAIQKNPSTLERLDILSRDARYDLACACGTAKDEHRRRSRDNAWIYPVILPNGGYTYLFKTLLSNECVNNCKYCPLRTGSDTQRCALSPEEMVKSFLDYYKAGRVSGLFLSSAVSDNPDSTMERINRTALILRRMQFKGYIHLKVIPGSSQAAIRQSVSLASAVSLNIETPGEKHFSCLSTTKNYSRDIIEPIKFISRLTGRGSRFEKVKHTTQFVVGAAHETDKEIIEYSWKLYKSLGLNRIYFSAYQRGLGAPELSGRQEAVSNSDLLIREHRLYQADWLVRKYGYKAEEIPLEPTGNLSLSIDPKEAWARRNPDFFPVNLNKDAPLRLLRVPGLGQVTVERILDFRKKGIRLRSLACLGRQTKILKKAIPYIAY